MSLRTDLRNLADAFSSHLTRKKITQQTQEAIKSLKAGDESDFRALSSRVVAMGESALDSFVKEGCRAMEAFSAYELASDTQCGISNRRQVSRLVQSLYGAARKSPQHISAITDQTIRIAGRVQSPSFARDLLTLSARALSAVPVSEEIKPARVKVVLSGQRLFRPLAEEEGARPVIAFAKCLSKLGEKPIATSKRNLVCQEFYARECEQKDFGRIFFFGGSSESELHIDDTVGQPFLCEKPHQRNAVAQSFDSRVSNYKATKRNLPTYLRMIGLERRADTKAREVSDMQEKSASGLHSAASQKDVRNSSFGADDGHGLQRAAVYALKL